MLMRWFAKLQKSSNFHIIIKSSKNGIQSRLKQELVTVALPYVNEADDG
jgi:hypothetical protein